MKTLYLYRHPPKDGLNGTIGPKGLELAYEQGKLVNLGFSNSVDIVDGKSGVFNRPRRFGKFFQGWQIQNAQAALEFFRGLGYVPKSMPIVFELGDDALFKQIITERFNSAVARGLSLFRAVRETHGDNQAMAWGELGRMALMKMFDTMADGEYGIGFFYGIPIMLAAWACGAEKGNVSGWDDLGEMEMFIFTCDEEGIPVLTRKVGVDK